MRQTRDSMFCVCDTKTTSVQKTKIREHYCFATVQTNKLPAFVGEVSYQRCIHIKSRAEFDMLCGNPECSTDSSVFMYDSELCNCEAQTSSTWCEL